MNTAEQRDMTGLPAQALPRGTWIDPWMTTSVDDIMGLVAVPTYAP